VLCSDGLANMIDDEELRKVVDRSPLDGAAQKLVEMANERGGDDNITVILVRAVA
jgi:protein phosphatase